MTVYVEGPGIRGRRQTFRDARRWKIDSGAFLVETRLGEWRGFAPGVWSTFEIS